MLLQQSQQDLSLKSYITVSEHACRHCKTNTPPVITLQIALIKCSFMKSQVEHTCKTSFFSSIDDPSNNEACVRMIVHLAMDGYQQAIQAMQRACFAAFLSTGFLFLLWRNILCNGLLGQDGPVVIKHGHFEITVLLLTKCYSCPLLFWCGINCEKGVE